MGQLVLAAKGSRRRPSALSPHYPFAHLRASAGCRSACACAWCHVLWFQGSHLSAGKQWGGCGISTSLSIFTAFKTASQSPQLSAHMSANLLHSSLYTNWNPVVFNPADTRVELYIIYRVKFSLISSWDPALIITIIRALYHILVWTWNRPGTWVSQYWLDCEIASRSPPTK